MNSKGNQKLGYLAMCADRRFHAAVERKFRELTGFLETEYWIEARVGGAPAMEDSPTADYAYECGAREMGWAAHGSNCGGFPGVSDEEMKAKLEETARERQKQYPQATHYLIFSIEKETTGEKVEVSQT